MADTKPSDLTLTLTQRITNAYNLMLSARRNGETAAEQTYANRMNALLERIPRPARS